MIDSGNESNIVITVRIIGSSIMIIDNNCEGVTANEISMLENMRINAISRETAWFLSISVLKTLLRTNI